MSAVEHGLFYGPQLSGRFNSPDDFWYCCRWRPWWRRAKWWIVWSRTDGQTARVRITAKSQHQELVIDDGRR